MRFRIYIKPFDEDGTYQDWIDVTEDVDIKGMGSLTQKVDNDEFNVGIFKISSLPLTLANASGKYSSTNVSESIFRYKRGDSQVKVTWAEEDYPAQCGIAICGEAIAYGGETEFFTGLLNDASLNMDIKDQKVKFKVLGKESMFARVNVPYTDISNGDYISAAIYTCLNQAQITGILNVDVGNISVGIDVQIDDKSDLENKTVKEALDEFLEKSGSVLFIKDDTIYVQDRSTSPPGIITFYGQASENGAEDIKNIGQIKTGLNKTFNTWLWDGITSTDVSSIEKYGTLKKETSSEIITNNTSKQNILDNHNNEFKLPKEDFELTTLITHNNLNLTILEGALIDYPTVYHPAGDELMALYGHAIYGVDSYPTAEWAKTYDTTTTFKIMGRKVDTQNHLITFFLSEVL